MNISLTSMKKSIKLTTLIIAITIISCLLVSCAKTGKTDEKNNTLSDSETISTTETKEEGTQDTLPEAETSEQSENDDGVGGGGTEYGSYYHIGFRSVDFGYVDKNGNPVNFENTFIREREDEVFATLNKYDSQLKMNDCRYRNLLWYVVKELGLTREEVEQYESLIEEGQPEKLTDEQIDALFIEDECEARNAMREPWTLFDGELVYTIEDIARMTKEEFKSHNFSNDDVQRLTEYFESLAKTLDDPAKPESFLNLLYDYAN